MTNDDKRAGSSWRIWFAIASIVLLAAGVGLRWYLTSERFNTWVRGRIVDGIEQATGGRTEIGRIGWSLHKLEFDLRDVTIHGKEAPDEVPYVRVERIFGRAKIISLFGHEVGLRYLEIDRPVVHLIVYPDGSTNQPRPRIKRDLSKSIQTLFETAINEARVDNGTLLINDHPVPLSFVGRELAAVVNYDFGASRYDGSLRVGGFEAKISRTKPLSAAMESHFSVWQNRFELKSGSIVSGKSRITATGELLDFAHPKIKVNYNASMDLADPHAILHTPEIRGGILNVQGSANYQASEFGSTGKVKIQGFTWGLPGLVLRDAAAGATFSLDHKNLRFKNIFAVVLGGTVTGSGLIQDWAAAGHQGKSAETQLNAQKGSLQLELNGLLVPSITQAISTQKLPLRDLKLVGRVDGNTTVTWKGSPRNSLAEVAAKVSAPQRYSAGQLPVAGSARGTYDVLSQRIEVKAADLFTPATHVRASGLFGLSTADLKLNATTSDLGEFKPILAARKQAAEIPVELHGQATFDGKITGRISALSAAGDLRITNFDSLMGLPNVSQPTSSMARSNSEGGSGNTTATPRRRMHWDVMTALLRYSPDTIAFTNGLLRRGAAQVDFDITAQLRKYQFANTLPFTARITARRAELADIQALAGYDYPISGALDLALQISGSQAEPQGAGHVQLTDAVIYGQPMARMSSEIRFVNHEAQFTNLEMQQNQARANGSAAYNLTTRGFQFSVRGTNFSLASLKALQHPKMQTAGTMNFSAEGAGTPESPSINADLSITKLLINGERVGDVKAHARTAGEMMTVEARSNIADSDLRLSGTVRLRDEFATKAAIRFDHLNLDPFLRAYSKGQITGHSSFAGTVDISGPLRQARNLDVKGELTEFYIPVETLHIRNKGPIRFTVAQNTFNLQQLHVVAEDTDLNASGTADLGGQGRLSMRAEGRANLKLVQSLNPDYISYGLVTMNVRIGGTISDPRINGQLQVANAGLSHIDLPNGLSDINGTLVFNRDRLQIQALTARTGGGTLNLSGYLTYGRTLGFNIDAAAEDFRLRYPPGISAMADAKLRLTGTVQSSQLSGDVTITRFGLNRQFDFASYVARAKQPPELPKPNSPLNNLRLDIHVTSTPELQVQTSLARLSGNADLNLRGTAAKPSVLGRVDIVEGDIFFNGTKYHLERGDITFTNPTRIEPYLDVQASTHVRDYDITLGFHGSTEKLSTTYRSDPPLATADIIALLAFGRTREETAMQPVSSQNFTETASNAILGQALNATVSSRVQKLFGVSRIKIDPQVGGAENNPSSARVTIEQQVKNDLTITYITDVTRTNQQIVSLEYNVTRAVSIVAVRDQNGVVSFDVRIRQRRR